MQADEAALAARQQALDDLSTLLSASRVARFAYAERLAKEASTERIQETLDLWQSLWRDVLLAGAARAHPGPRRPRAHPHPEPQGRPAPTPRPPPPPRPLSLV